MFVVAVYFHCFMSAGDVSELGGTLCPVVIHGTPAGCAVRFLTVANYGFVVAVKPFVLFF